MGVVCTYLDNLTADDNEEEIENKKDKEQWLQDMTKYQKSIKKCKSVNSAAQENADSFKYQISKLEEVSRARMKAESSKGNSLKSRSRG